MHREGKEKDQETSTISCQRREELQTHNIANVTKSSQQYQPSFPPPSSSVWAQYQNTNGRISCRSGENNTSLSTYGGDIEKDKETRKNFEQNHSISIHPHSSPMNSPSSSSSSIAHDQISCPAPVSSHAAASDHSINPNLKKEDDEMLPHFVDKNMPPLISANGSSALMRRISQCSTASNSSSVHSPRYESGEFNDISEYKSAIDNKNIVKNVLLPMHLPLKEDGPHPGVSEVGGKGHFHNTFGTKESICTRAQAVPRKLDGKNYFYLHFITYLIKWQDFQIIAT